MIRKIESLRKGGLNADKDERSTDPTWIEVRQIFAP
jgi:hypothetical protein